MGTEIDVFGNVINRVGGSSSNVQRDNTAKRERVPLREVVSLDKGDLLVEETPDIYLIEPGKDAVKVSQDLTPIEETPAPKKRGRKKKPEIVETSE